SIAQLGSLTRDNPRQQKRLAEFRGAVKERLQFFTKYGFSGVIPGPLASARNHQVHDRILTLLAQMDNEEELLQVGRSQRLAAIYRWWSLLGPFTLVLGAFGGLLGIWLFTRDIVRRAAVISREIALVAEGGILRHPDPHSDELGEVSLGVMRTSLLLSEKQATLQKEIGERQLLE